MELGWHTGAFSRAGLEQSLKGHYALGPLLDQGGVANLYRATCLQTNRQVAIKTLRPLMALDDELAAMFVDEMALLQQLSHPHVVACLQAYPHNTPPYLVMECIEGCNLAQFHQWLQQRPSPPPWQVAYEIATALAKGLAYLHNANSPTGLPLELIHRDLSPPNVLLDTQGAVKLTDFGISIYRNMSRSTEGRDPKGRFSYLAPEMLQGVAIDQRADIFSWGVITWELLTGHRLFQADTPEETLALLGEAPVLSPTDFQPDLPPSFEQIVMTALKRERSQRMPNVQALCTQLEDVPFSPASMPYRVALLKKMNPSWHNTNTTGTRD